MTLVLVDDFTISFLLWGFITLTLTLIGVAIAWLIDYFIRTPKEAKTVKKASNKHRPLLILQGDDGFTDFKMGYKQGPEGILETLPERVGRLKKSWVGLVARKVDKALLNAPDFPDNERKLVEFLGESATHTTSLRHAKVPLLVGYLGKVPLTRIAHIVGLQNIEKLASLFPNSFQTVDLSMIKTLFPMPWDETQMDRQAQIKYNEGFHMGQKGKSQQEFKILLLMLIGLFGIIAAIVIISKVL